MEGTGRERKSERRRQWWTKRSRSWRNGEREKKGSNSFSFSSLIRLVNRLFWRSRRSHNRATSLFGSAERKRTEHGHHWCSEASLFSSPSPPGCVCLDRPSRLSDMRADIRAKLHLRPSAFALLVSLSPSFSLRMLFDGACEGKRLQDGGSGCAVGRVGCLWNKLFETISGRCQSSISPFVTKSFRRIEQELRVDEIVLRFLIRYYSNSCRCWKVSDKKKNKTKRRRLEEAWRQNE